MALSDKQILDEIEKGNIVITPFVKNNLSSSSYDVTLGMEYFECAVPVKNYYNPYSEKDVKSIWQLKKAIKWRDRGENHPMFGEECENINDDDHVITICPGGSILCHTNEFIGGRNNITTMMKSRSSIGRNFLETCSCSGWGDVGYVNRWTMEIRNNSQHYHIPLIVERRVAQIVFLPTGETVQSYSNKGKYQTEADFEKLRTNWKPEDMLPKMYLDREIFDNRAVPLKIKTVEEIINKDSQVQEISKFGKSRGDWYCPKCEYIIFGRKSRCKKCGTRKPAPVKHEPEPMLKLELNERRNGTLINDQSIRDFFGQFMALGPQGRSLVFCFQHKGKVLYCTFDIDSEYNLVHREYPGGPDPLIVKRFAAHFEKFDIDQIMNFISKYETVKRISATFGYYNIDAIIYRLCKAGLVEYTYYEEDKRSGHSLRCITRIGETEFINSRSSALSQSGEIWSEMREMLVEAYKDIEKIEYPSKDILRHTKTIEVKILSS